jgi:hypothetical protein
MKFFLYFAILFSLAHSMDSSNNTKKFFDDEEEIFNLINNLAEFIDFNDSFGEIITNYYEDQFFIFMPKRIFIDPEGDAKRSFEFLDPVEDFIDVYYVIKNPLTENLIFYFCKRISPQRYKKTISSTEYKEKLNLKRIEDTKFFYYSKNQINLSYEEIEEITIFEKAFKFKNIESLKEYNKNVEKTFVIPKNLLEDYKECKIDPKIKSFFEIKLKEIKKIF